MEHQSYRIELRRMYAEKESTNMTVSFSINSTVNSSDFNNRTRSCRPVVGFLSMMPKFEHLLDEVLTDRKRNMSARLVLISILTASVLHLSTASSMDLLTAASKCCPSTEACCMENIKNNTRIDCFDGNKEREGVAADCLQKEMFGDLSLRFAAFGDTQCCALFDLSDNEASGSCSSTCTTLMTTPSLSSKQKLGKIKKCSKDSYVCFRRCQIWLRSERHPSAIFPIHEHCNATSFMKTGRVYLGEQLMR